MESARNKYTSEIIEAEDLWLLDVVDTNGYVCWGCGIEMYPSAWQKGSKKRPSFNKMPGKEHINCDADAESTVVKQGQKKSVRNMLDSAPGLMPAGLKLIEQRPVVDPGTTGSDNNTNPIRSTSSESSGGNAPARQSRRPVNAIRQICRAFIRFPYDRGMSLNIPGINADTYMTVFKKLKDPVQPYLSAEFFIRSCYGRNLSKTKTELSFRSRENGQKTNLVSLSPRVAINYTLSGETGQKPKKTMLLNELETVQEEAKEAVNKKAKERAQVFFIGEQSTENPEIFYVSDYRLICAIMGYIIYP